MDFGSAVNMMQQGIPMTRTEWDNQEEYIELDGELFIKHLPAHARREETTLSIVFFAHEVLATDWEVVRNVQPT